MKSILILTFVLAISASVSAQEATARVDRRQAVQRTRIHEGRTRGEVNRREVAALKTEQRHIRRSERRMTSDGNVTRYERRRLEQKQDRANRHIRRAKHNKPAAE